MPETPDLKPGGFRQVSGSFEPLPAQVAPLSATSSRTEAAGAFGVEPQLGLRTAPKSGRRLLVLAIGVGLFALLAAITSIVAIPRIEDHLQTEALQRLDDAGIQGAMVELDGRTATISGLSGADAEEAERILDAEWGIRDAKIANGDPQPVVVPDDTVAPPGTSAPPVTESADEDDTADEVAEPDPVEEADEPPITAVPEVGANLDDELASLEERFNADGAFAPGSANLTPAATTVLDDTLAVLEEFPEATIQIEGHTDDQGDTIDNLLLSQARADAVADYLIADGVAAERLVAVGLGENDPIADNATSAGRAMNRRTEFAALR